MNYNIGSTHVIIEFCVEEKNVEKEYELEFDFDGHHTEEYDIIEEFYNRIRYVYKLTYMKWFKIINTGKKYTLDKDNENEPYSKLLEMVVMERTLSRMENEVVDYYKEYLNAKKEYWQSLENKKSA